ncbi:hypothetical protein C7B65_26780 [Phormidesmis priestleyi ULC007]|uniref:ISAzo13 family transposase n=2 Tax=Phormidesmis priestleyi TaxID=268141 RepID=A0A2T1D0Q7_9CYAN|nr:hypothetical protein C7B65_26780 [Phormidesmis priestleyi ULC007]
MILPTKSWVKPFPMECMTSLKMMLACQSASVVIQPSSLSKRSGDGGTNWGSLGMTKSHRLLITADSGGSNGHRNRLWKELQRLADGTGMKVEVCHYPPGTSKWNKIEHRLFCHITRKGLAKK